MSKSTNPQRTMPEFFRLLMRLPVPWVFVVAYLVGAGLEYLLPVYVRSPQGTLLSEIGGAGIFLLGAALAGWSLFVFRQARTTTVPGEHSATLVTSGPYRFTRNPMYVGLSLAYIGEAGILVQVWPLLLLPLVIAYLNGVVIPLEETRLTEDFGEAYMQYCARVHRWI